MGNQKPEFFYCLGNIFSTIKRTFGYVNWANRQIPHPVFIEGYLHIIVLTGGNSTFNFSLFFQYYVSLLLLHIQHIVQHWTMGISFHNSHCNGAVQNSRGSCEVLKPILSLKRRLSANGNFFFLTRSL